MFRRKKQLCTLEGAALEAIMDQDFQTAKALVNQLRPGEAEYVRDSAIQLAGLCNEVFVNGAAE